MSPASKPIKRLRLVKESLRVSTRVRVGATSAETGTGQPTSTTRGTTPWHAMIDDSYGG
jgi:hypothetical protein